MTGLELNWAQIGSILAVFLVISLVFETALSPLFNWRVFAQHFEGKGAKTPITIVAAVALLWSYDIDIFQQLVSSFRPTGNNTNGGTSAVESSVFGRIMTGFLVAGGSGAIFNIFAKLGLRNPKELREKAEAARQAATARKADQEAAVGPAAGDEGAG